MEKGAARLNFFIIYLKKQNQTQPQTNRKLNSRPSSRSSSCLTPLLPTQPPTQEAASAEEAGRGAGALPRDDQPGGVRTDSPAHAQSRQC